MNQSTLNLAREVFAIESEAVARLSERLDERFERAIELLLGCRGRVVVTGVGKSGHIGRKLASTLASTGTPALFLHAGEGLHGDLGMVTASDVLIAISYTGRTGDLTGLLPIIKDMGVPIIALTGNPNSFLAAQADVVLDISVQREACPLNLAPTASTTAALAMGDALAVCAMQGRKFSSDDFARTHPGGTLGITSKLRVADLMRQAERVAIVVATASVRDTLRAITDAQAGAALVIDDQSTLIGYLTDGDVRRHLLNSDNAEDVLRTAVAQFMTRNPLAFSPAMLAVEALRALQERGVDDAPVVDDENRAIGLLDVQELLRAGLV